LCLCRYFYEHGLVFSCTLEPPNIMLRFRPIIIRDIHLYTVSVWCYSRICVRTWSLGQNLTHNRRANVELSILLSLWISLVVFSIDGQSNYTAISEQGRKVKCVRQDRHALGYFMTRNDAAHELQTTTSNRSASTSRRVHCSRTAPGLCDQEDDWHVIAATPCIYFATSLLFVLSL